MSIDKMNHYSLTNPASQYDEESLTALELAARTAGKVNECVDAVNKIPDTVADTVNKHIEKGTFDDQIDEHTEALLDAIEDAKKEMEQDVANLGARVDNLLGSMEVGSTTMDAEVIDARTGADGTAKANLGTVTRHLENLAIGYGGCVVNIGSQAKVTLEGSKITITNSEKFYIVTPHNSFMTIEYSDFAAQLPEYATYDATAQVFTLTLDTGAAHNIYYNVITGELSRVSGYATTHSKNTILLAGNYYSFWHGLFYEAAVLKHFQKDLKRDEKLSFAMANATNIVHVSNNCDIRLKELYDGTGYCQIEIDDKIVVLDNGMNDYSPETWEDATTEISEYVTIDGNKITIRCPYRKYLILNKSTKKLMFTTSPANNNGIVLFACGWDNLTDSPLLALHMKNRVKELEKAVAEARANSQEVALSDADRVKIRNFSTLTATAGEFDSFLFFTDPHLCQFSGESWRSEFYQYMNAIGACYNEAPVDRVICGGDWLGHEELPEEAYQRLALVDSMMRDTFKNYHNVVGNHDTNYQGKLNADSERYTGKITNEAIRNLWFREEGKAYYKIESQNTTFFVFDAQTENEAISDYENEQLSWFASELKANNAQNLAIISHMVYYSGTSLQPIASAFLELANTFNNRGTATVNGVVYDFSDCVGSVRFCLAGHNHKDDVSAVANIPVILTTHTRDGNVPTYDLCLCDYDNNVLRMVRIGTGEDRTVNI